MKKSLSFPRGSDTLLGPSAPAALEAAVLPAPAAAPAFSSPRDRPAPALRPVDAGELPGSRALRRRTRLAGIGFLLAFLVGGLLAWREYSFAQYAAKLEGMLTGSGGRQQKMTADLAARDKELAQVRLDLSGSKAEVEDLKAKVSKNEAKHQAGLEAAAAREKKLERELESLRAALKAAAERKPAQPAGNVTPGE